MFHFTKSLFLLSLLVFLPFCGITQAKDILSVSEYNQLRYVATTNEGSMSVNEARQLLAAPCFGRLQGDHMLVSPSCLLHDDFPSYDWTQMVDDSWDDIIAFGETYDLEATSYDISPSIAYMSEQEGDISSLRVKKRSDVHVVQYMLHAGYMLAVPKREIARYFINTHGIYAVHKDDLHKQSNCARTNYLLALRSLDNLRLAPGEEFDINSHITGLQGYCRGSKTFMFYSGVCGASTQLYRAALMHPDLFIVERNNHTIRYTQYYADYIYSDDAAIYENAKKLIIRNDSDDTMIFRVKEEEWETTLAVFSQPTSAIVSLKKEQTGPLSGIVRKEVKDQYGMSVQTQERKSRYNKKYTGSN